MNLRELREEAWDYARELLNVPDSDRLWTAREMNRYINRVYRKIARDTKCISDSRTPEVCLIASDPVDYTTYTPGTLDYIWANDPDSWLYQLNVCPYVYPLHHSILDIDEVKWTKRDIRLHKVSSQKWRQNMRWEQTVGLPFEYATDLQNNHIALNYRSAESDTLQLVVKRMPLVDLSNDTDVPEIRLHYHDFMLPGILEQMFDKRDAEVFDEAKSSKFGKEFKANITEIKEEESRLNERLRPNHAMEGHL